MGMTTTGSREINVTPLIDVLLVLLIIFLVMMPIMLRSESLELPPHEPGVSSGMTMSVQLDADLSVSIDNGPRLPFSELAPGLRTRLNKVSAVFVDFVDGVPWRHVIATIDTIRGVADDVQPSVVVAARLHE